MQADATEASVNQVSALLSDSIVYEHPRVGARLVGRATLVAGIRGFRGKSRDARIEVLRQIAGPGVVAAEERVSFEAMDGGGWRETTRTQLSVYEITGGRISRLIEYWYPSLGRPAR